MRDTPKSLREAIERGLGANLTTFGDAISDAEAEATYFSVKDFLAQHFTVARIKANVEGPLSEEEVMKLYELITS